MNCTRNLSRCVAQTDHSTEPIECARNKSKLNLHSSCLLVLLMFVGGPNKPTKFNSNSNANSNSDSDSNLNPKSKYEFTISFAHQILQPNRLFANCYLFSLGLKRTSYFASRAKKKKGFNEI